MSSVAIALAPKPFCALSILCSYVVIRETSHPANRTSKRDRAMRACLKNFAIADLIFSVAYFFTTWPMPADALDYFHNVGTTATCSAQGFFIEFGAFASSLFSVDLSILFVLMVRYNALESTLVNFQYWSQIAIWGICLGFSVLYLCLGFYNPNTAYCWLGPYPYDCWWSEEGECLRGMMSFWALYTDAAIGFIGPLVAQIFLFAWLYRTVHEIEDPTRRQSQSTRQFSSAIVRHGSSRSINDATVTTSSQAAVNRTRSRAVAVRGLYYIGGYLLTYILSFIELILQFFTDTSNIAVPAACLLATQGLWTAIVFMRQRKMLTPEGIFLRKVLWCFMPASSDKNNDSTSGGGRNASTKKFPSGVTNSQRGPTRVVIGFDGKPVNVSEMHNSGLGNSTQHDKSVESLELEEQGDEQDNAIIAELAEISKERSSPTQEDEPSTEEPTPDAPCGTNNDDMKYQSRQENAEL